ncbi:ATP-binding cassette domain-containing protein [Vibrio sp. 404]|uniref:ATP-binding cassette domain-containing protein n=1 Tax=Vibrio marinisediminis TaxID=2758441 RepID=A0A7W2FQR8_9VIBR|nr:ATP-binding cassette domain-containing protein [Vibrio marinisediminis]MBA5762554.1 ATP-binding cassette domain-containing protein [Vibrio marinisediminis]
MDINKNHWNEITPFNKQIISTLIFSGFFLNILVLAVPIYSLQVFDRVLTSRSLDTLLLISAIVFFLLLTQSTLDVLKNRYLYKKSTKLDALLSSHLFVTNITSANKPTLQDVKEIKSFMVSPAFSLPFDIIWTPIFLLVMFILHPIVGLLGLSAILLVGGLALFIHKAKAKQLSESQLMNSACKNASEQAAYQVESIKAQHLETGLRTQFQHLTAERVWHDLQLGVTTSTLTSTAKCLRLTLQMAIMGIGAWLVIGNNMTAGGIIAGSILMSRALQPLEQLPSTLQGWHSAVAANQRLTRYFNDLPTEKNSTDFSDIKGCLHLDSVSWYPPKAKLPLLKNLRFKLEAGNRVMVMGASSSGKTVLCKLLVNLYQPSSGSVKIDDAQLSQWNPNQLKAVLGYVPQHVEFITGTIKQNIAHFDPNLTDAEVIAAATSIGIHQDIVKLPEGYNTVIGNNILPLSAGLAKGIAIARALYFRPHILVMDEADANLDSNNLAAFKHLLDQLKQNNVAVVMVSHNKDLISNVDWVVQLENGEITSAYKSDQAAKVHNLQPVASNG